MKKTVRITLTAALLGTLAASCGKSPDQNTFDRQETNIQTIAESLVKSNPDATTDYNKGSVKVTVAHGEGEALEDGGAVSFYYAGYYITGSSLNSSNIFATNYDVLAESIGWNVSDSTAFTISTINLAEDDLVEGLKNGLVGVKGGDECYILFSGKHGFGKKLIANIPANAALAYHLWVKGVSNRE